MNFETIVGLEVHVELKTDTKIFSPAPAHFGAAPNMNIHPTDLAYPGTLPTMNKQAIDFGMKASMALNCDVARVMNFDRKHYFYPDNPKAYQISQDDRPVGANGWIEIEVDGYKKKIRIERVHLEEDAGKLTHSDNGYSLVDLNRQGTPLIEIVTEADIRTPNEAYAFLEKLKAIIQYTGVSDVRMEEGSLRCDANISLRPYGQEEFGTKTELKNLNSFNFVRRGIANEVERQEKLLLTGEKIVQQTRRYDEATGQTVLMRVKGSANDYRFINDPDLPEIVIDEDWIERVRAEIPELPDARKNRYVNELDLPAYDAHVLTLTKEMSDFFDETVKAGADAKLASNWLMGGVSEYLNAEGKELKETPITPAGLASLVKLISDGTISSKIAKKVFKELAENGGDAAVIVKEKGLVQISDEGTLRKVIGEILDANEQSIEDYKNGKDRAVGFLVGQVMKATKGQANPPLVNKLLLDEISKR
ncbi:Asp-tRNA(Asn)/Glu-tRNA(Gln) amidotransferase subunit GatB [Sporosarcina gallistercoris]|uniref:Aspartyl/glutamyl-tRNA(Asn/Gln) amidotransferase subunit B n=1 Tax=Sporosarcina gallistercoris TaxID=2762245 RepID=A0ABR8PK79_9BACL|nr:Asp-tRNA(Asn)/Glu-tRNA(Gln) amidotransferase subunit GatB [Sporosarcina gallistercoris]MBD7908484.1 Asp-tRNA(Asn)/Glu-tRNA(Gln) amidotransferase subunit GatB [Sporosarcina gallistercoris]